MSYAFLFLDSSPYHSVIEAAIVGAMDAIPICGGILANLIAFLSIYNFFNRTLVWIGYRACLKFDLTFEVGSLLLGLKLS